MTLTVTPTEIQIKNAGGTVKFTSSNKLVYRKATKTNTLTVGNLVVLDPFQATSNNDFLVVSFRINSSTGNVAQQLIGPTFVANAPTVIAYDAVATGPGQPTFTVEQEVLNWDLRGSTLAFFSERFGSNSTYAGPIVTTNLTYSATIYSYL